MKKREYIVAGEGEKLECSQCDQECDVIARIPMRTPLWANPKEPSWIGLCEPCVARLLAGFKSGPLVLGKGGE